MYVDMVVFRNSGVVFQLKGDILSMTTEYDFNKTDSPDAKQITNFLDEMHFDIHAKYKSSSDENLITIHHNKRTLLALGLHEVIFLSENPIELFNRLRLIIEGKQVGNDTNKFDNEFIAIFKELLEYKSLTPKQHKQFLFKIILLHTKKAT